MEAVGEGAITFQGVIDPATGKTQGYMQLIFVPDKGTLTMDLSNNIGRLAQGIGNRIKGTNNIFFIHRSAVPADKRVPYGQIVVSIRPNKSKTYRVRINISGSRLLYEGPTATKCASLTTTNIILNSVVSTLMEMFMCADIHDFYYNTPMVYF